MRYGSRVLPSVLVVVLTLLTLSGCATSPERFTTLLGEPLCVPEIDEARARGQLEKLAEAEERLAADPESEDAIVWVGRRLGYLGRFREALDVYTRGLEIHPDSVRLLRHRGHRWISVRELDRAVADLQRAADRIEPGAPLHVEKDGLPVGVDRGGFTSFEFLDLTTTEGNVHYHLGLAHYLRGDFEAALAAYDRRVTETDRNADNRCATAYWRYLCLARLGRTAAAEEAVAGITGQLAVQENRDYRDLVLLFRGELEERDLLQRRGLAPYDESSSAVAGATLGYGLVMSTALRTGDREQLERRCREILAARDACFAFGYIAAEAELASPRRLR